MEGGSSSVSTLQLLFDVIHKLLLEVGRQAVSHLKIKWVGLIHIIVLFRIYFIWQVVIIYFEICFIFHTLIIVIKKVVAVYLLPRSRLLYFDDVLFSRHSSQFFLLLIIKVLIYFLNYILSNFHWVLDLPLEVWRDGSLQITRLRLEFPYFIELHFLFVNLVVSFGKGLEWELLVLRKHVPLVVYRFKLVLFRQNWKVLFDDFFEILGEESKGRIGLSRLFLFLLNNNIGWLWNTLPFIWWAERSIYVVCHLPFSK